MLLYNLIYMDKNKYFEAFVYELLNWYNETINNKENDLSILKILKLLFLSVSWDDKKLDIFDNFVAWELWPVERDIYTLLKNNSIKTIQTTNKSTKIIWEKNNLDKKYIEAWKEMVNYLKQKNPKLINYSASTLVDITHKWNCWKLTKEYSISKIEKKLILSEEWYFFT